MWGLAGCTWWRSCARLRLSTPVSPTLTPRSPSGMRGPPGTSVIDSLPGAGPALAPRLWVACAAEGDQPEARTMQLKSGIAPVQQQSGNSKAVCFRWARPHFLASDVDGICLPLHHDLVLGRATTTEHARPRGMAKGRSCGHSPSNGSGSSPDSGRIRSPTMSPSTLSAARPDVAAA